MRVVNCDKGTVLVESGRVTRSAFDRSVGLMFRPSLAAGDGLLIIPCNSIHSCFMRFRFDAAFLSKQGQVLHTIHAMAPWRLSRIVWRGHSVLELPAGTLRSASTEIGDRLLVEE